MHACLLLDEGVLLTRKPNSAMVSDKFTKIDVTPNIVFLHGTKEDKLKAQFSCHIVYACPTFP